MILDLVAFEAFARRILIPSRDEGLRPLWPLMGTQTYLLHEIARALEDGIADVVVLKGGRQIGGTTLLETLMLLLLQTHDGMIGMFVADEEENRNYRRDLHSEMLASLPPEYRQPSRVDNANIRAWGSNPATGYRGSRLIYAYAGRRAGTGGASGSNLGRSRGVSLLLADEFFGWPDDHVITALRASLSKRNPQRLYLWNGTARGFGATKARWDIAKTAITQRAVFLPWWRHQGYSIARTEKSMWDRYGKPPMDEDERRWTAIVRKRYGVTITREQVAWFRWVLAEECAGDDSMRQQEYGCLVGETRVSTTQGLRRFDAAETATLTESGPVLGWFPQGSRPVVQATTRDGRILIGTPDHRIERPDGTFIELGDAAGSLVSLRAPRFADRPYQVRWGILGGIRATLTIDETWGRFLGYFMGDGCYSRGMVSIACTGKDDDVVADVRGLMRSIFDTDVTPQVAGRRRTQGAPPGCLELRVGSVVFAEIMKRLGIWNAKHHSAQLNAHRRVCVPEAIFRSPKEVVREFLRGLFEADGFIDWRATRVLLFSKHVAFLRDVQLLLLGFGITSRVKTAVRHNRLGGKLHSYTANELTLRTLESVRFSEEIGFISERKRSRVRIRTLVRQALMPIEFVDQCVSVEPAGEADVYDFSIDTPEHTFSANGIVVHNCLEEEVFVAFGDRFISTGVLRRLRAGLTTAPRPTGWRYVFGDHLEDTEAVSVDPADADLLLWEEAERGGAYLVAAHPAYSSSQDAPHFCAQVWRLWPDRMRQVAEYWAEDGEFHKFAWVLVHLAGHYSSVAGLPAYLIGEVGYTGQRVLGEIQRLERYGYGLGPDLRSQQFRNVAGNIRHYLYRKLDALRGSATAYWPRTTLDLRASFLNGLRDEIERRHLEIRSSALVDELAMLRRGEAGDRDMIAGGGDSSEERALTAAHAVECWLTTAMPELVSMVAPKEPPPEAPRHPSEAMLAAFFADRMRG